MYMNPGPKFVPLRTHTVRAERPTPGPVEVSFAATGQSGVLMGPVRSPAVPTVPR